MTQASHQTRPLEDLYASDTPEPADTSDTRATTAQDTGDTPAATTEAASATGDTAGGQQGAPPAPQKAPDNGMVPRKALEDERRKRQQLEREFAAARKQGETPNGDRRQGDEPDPLVDPGGFRQHLRDEIRREVIEDSRADMIDEVGEDEFTSAENAFLAAVQSDPAFAEQMSARIARSRDPARIAHREGKKLLEAQAKAQAENDPAAIRAALKAEILAELGHAPAAEAPPAVRHAAPAPSAVAKRPAVPPSLAGMRSAGPAVRGTGKPAHRPIESLYGDD